MKLFLLLMFLAVLTWAAPPNSSGETVGIKDSVYHTFTKDGVSYLAYAPGFPDGANCWNSICVTPEDQVFIGVANHKFNAGLFRYDANRDTMSYLGDVLGNGKLWMHEYQAKIHTQLVQYKKDGLIYFGSDYGNGNPARLEYEGGHWFCINPATNEVRHLGLAIPGVGLKSLAVDQIRGRLFATTDPMSRFLVADIEKLKSNDFGTFQSAHQDLGCVNVSHEPRVLMADKWGNVYAANESAQLVKYVAATGELIRTNTRLPFAEGTPSSTVTSGPAGVASVNNGEYFYGITHNARIFKFTPEQNGEGVMEDLGAGLGDNRAYNSHTGTLSFAMGKNNKLYFEIGGHNNYFTKDSSAVLVEFDPVTKEKGIIHSFDRRLTECTGGGCDSKGNVYLAGHRYLIKFNPSTIKRIKAL